MDTCGNTTLPTYKNKEKSSLHQRFRVADWPWQIDRKPQAKKWWHWLGPTPDPKPSTQWSDHALPNPKSAESSKCSQSSNSYKSNNWSPPFWRTVFVKPPQPSPIDVPSSLIYFHAYNFKLTSLHNNIKTIFNNHDVKWTKTKLWKLSYPLHFTRIITSPR